MYLNNQVWGTPEQCIEKIARINDLMGPDHFVCIMYGVNLNLDADGNVDSVSDGAGSLKAYYAMCEAQGIPRPNVLVG